MLQRRPRGLHEPYERASKVKGGRVKCHHASYGVVHRGSQEFRALWETSRPEVFGLGQDEGGSDDKKDDKK